MLPMYTGHDQIHTVNHLLTVHTGLTRLELSNNDLRDSEVQLLAATLKELSCDLKGWHSDALC